jgi:signal transduction histidine kinase
MPEVPPVNASSLSAFISSLKMYLRYPESRKARYYFLVVISIIGISYGLFFYIQHSIEEDTRNRLISEQTERQMEATKKISTDITSDLVSIVAIVQGLANSQFLQEGDLSSQGAKYLVREIFLQINSFSVVDRLFLLNGSDVVTMFMSAEGANTPFFGADEVSFKDLMQESKSKLEPTYTNGFKGTDGVQRIALIYPVVSSESGDYLGSIVGLIPTIKFFEHYGNVHDINSQYLTAYDSNGSYLSHPSKKLVGLNFFSEEIQQPISHNRELNKLVTEVIAEGQPGNTIYDYGTGERLNSAYPILLQVSSSNYTRSLYSISVVTPTSEIYSAIDQSLFLERIGMFSLLAGTTVAILVLLVFLHRWNRDLDNEVNKRTRELEDANELLASANEKLKKQEEIQNEFINIAAHELRTPLQPIMGYSAYALKGKVDINHALTVIHRQAKRLLAMASDLLLITRIETGNFSYKMERVRINDIILKVINNILEPSSDEKGIRGSDDLLRGLDNEEHRPFDAPTLSGKSGMALNDVLFRETGSTKEREPKETIREARLIEEEFEGGRTEEDEKKYTRLKCGNISIILDLDKHVGDIYADKERISQVLYNIVHNSIKFTETGTIKIKTYRTSRNASQKLSGSSNEIKGSEKLDRSHNLGRDKNDPMIEIQISDNGPGIPGEIIANLFEKFVTRDHSTRPNIHGTGLGLFICKSIIDYHGGTIRAWNNENGGATFSILLPSDPLVDRR